MAEYLGTGVNLKVADIAAARRFYENLLGMRPIYAYGDEEFQREFPPGVSFAAEAYRGVTYKPTADSFIQLTDGHVTRPAAEVFRAKVGSPKASFVLKVRSLVPFLRKEGLNPRHPLRHFYWGTIEMTIEDPDGLTLSLVAAYSDAEAAAVQQFAPLVHVPSAVLAPAGDSPGRG